MSVNSISSSTISSILQNTVTRLQSQLTTTSSESSTGLLADIGFSLGRTPSRMWRCISRWRT